ncbi:hypothetical protein G6F57_008287 [Rhizopus arrhizus]|uniref:SWIRM domain-containing protein n=1 Tax=Rhizopus oryzae TaxID=64495 RepID=A0A9P6X6M0_RHIOR|nr:hypothetical protein G6F23_002751 [Rhizopus arrhizus]KAG1411374.1 hypothetical protein G6F58_008584 [Rhizopus delemar]KAG0761403.1 hypothetical protein G6F24_007591 [Rhizopus arrhizus]KAG0787803.1 hypothetical protein G6F21_007655 [Rhizopus arrhizus]KAG0792216.1 hypothetical protein G6F22_005927 [Rhizopus arrhizus]
MIPISPPVTPKTRYDPLDADIEPILLDRVRHRRKSRPHRSLPVTTPRPFTLNVYSKRKQDTIDPKTSSIHPTLASHWAPDLDAFERYPSVRAIWKGTPLDIRHLPSFDLLHPGEVHIASTLRLPPEQYLKCKHSLLVHAQQFNQSNLPFRKSDAQKCVRIDVNKTSALWTVFYQLGWFKPRS